MCCGTKWKESSVLTNQEYQFINILEEKLKCLSPIQQNRAKKDRELYKAMGIPTVDNLKSDNLNESHQE